MAIEDDHPLQEQGNIKTHHVFIALAHIEDKIYSDQTGYFFIQSSWGNKYIVIVYVYDANAILSYPIRIDLLVNCYISSNLYMLNSKLQDLNLSFTN